MAGFSAAPTLAVLQATSAAIRVRLQSRKFLNIRMTPRASRLVGIRATDSSQPSAIEVARKPGPRRQAAAGDRLRDGRSRAASGFFVMASRCIVPERRFELKAAA